MVELLIDNKKFTYFSSYSITLKYNSIADSFSFTGLKDFLPGLLNYSVCKIKKDGELLITGTIINETRTKTAVPNLVKLSGYSLTGILEDCNIPISLYPLQSDNRTLSEIVSRLLKPFNIEYIIKGKDIAKSVNKKYIKTIAESGQSIKSYINSLASQRNIILTHNAEGNLVLSKGESLPKAININNSVSYSLSANGQGMHSEISVIKQASTKNPDAGEYTIKNKYVNKFRPKVKVLSNGDIFDVKEAAENELKAELLKIKLSIKLNEFIKPGTIINFPVEGIDIARWFVEETTLSENFESTEININCVPVEVYS